jgi:hypothetical protein
VVLLRADAILVVGCLAGLELGLAGPPVVTVPGWPALPDSTLARVDAPDRGDPARILCNG